MDNLDEIFAWATGLIDSLMLLVTDSPLTYLAVFGLTALDVLFPVLPAEAAITAAAVLAGQGALSIVWIMVAAFLGAILGDNVAYWVGRLAGRPLVDRIMRGDTSRLEKVEAQFRTRGGVLIIVGRFVPGGRTAVAIGAGVLQFPWRKFILFDILAAAIWVFPATLPGFIGGVVIRDKPWLALVIGFGLSIIVAGSLALYQRRREARADADVEAEAATEADAEAESNAGSQPDAVAESVATGQADGEAPT